MSESQQTTDPVASERFSKRDLLLVGSVLAMAIAIRLPYLNLIPPITDEAFEVLAALSIRQGHWILFGPVNPTAGPLVTYLLALAFWILGPSTYLPRAVIMVLGALTAVVTYLLGRSMGGRRAGFIAGALLACSPVHTIVNSHIAWSNSTTPFFITLTFLVLHTAVRRQDGRLLVAAGLLYGLALQTHVSMVVVIPGLVAWFLARRDGIQWLRRPWLYLAVGAALVGYGNMLIYHLIAEGGGLASFQTHSYAWVSQPTWSSYWTNLGTMVETVALTLGGQVPGVQDRLGSLVAVLLLAWLVVALIYASWRRETMPLLVILSAALIMPYVNKRYEGLLSQRYTTFLMPLAFAAMGLTAERAAGLWRRKRQPQARALAAVGTVLAVLLALFPVRTTLAYYAGETAAGEDNSLTLAMAHYIEESLPPQTTLYLASKLRMAQGDGGYRYLRALHYFLTLEGVDHQVLDFADITARLEADPPQDVWLLLSSRDYEVLRRSFDVEPIENAPPVVNDGLLLKYAPPGRSP